MGGSSLFAQAAPDGTIPVIVRFKNDRIRAVREEQDAVESNGGKAFKSFSLIRAAATRMTPEQVERLKANGLVEAVEPDVQIRALDAELDNTWGVKAINAGLVHDSGNKGAAVKVCVLDTGINTTHPELAPNYKGGYDFVNGDADPSDDNGHGTHTAGTIAAVMNGANVRGVAPQVDLYVYKILDAGGGGYASSIVSALQACVAVGGKVTNNSYGASSDLGTSVRAAFDNAKAAGVVNVASAGNSGAGANTVGFPGQYPSVIAVAATDSANNWAGFSSTGPAVAVAAPGVSILSTYLGGGYAYMSGTSMASPHVAGVAALVVACGITNPDSVKSRLTSTALDLGTAGRDDQYGYGLVQADKAAMNCGTTAPAPAPSPILDLAVSRVTAPSSTTVNTATPVSVTVSNTGNQTASGFTLTFSDNGTFVNSAAVPSLPTGGSATLTFNWSTSAAGGHALAGTLGQPDANTTNNTAQASTNVTQPVTTPPPTTSTISLSASTTRTKSKRYVMLQWSGAATANIVVTRSGSSSRTITATNDGSYTDSVGAGTFNYKICETNNGACSNTVTVVVN
ncbi:MAG: hypothetical protein RL328_485 [Acidobacteriota bacterium]